MSSYTPGPWCVRDLPTGQRYIGPAQDGGAPSVALVLARVNVPDERLAADARLVAAAPELLQALLNLVGTMCAADGSDMDADRDAIDANVRDARSAIAKATGAKA
jgi:hypothetical protein